MRRGPSLCSTVGVGLLIILAASPQGRPEEGLHHEDKEVISLQPLSNADADPLTSDAHVHHGAYERDTPSPMSSAFFTSGSGSGVDDGVTPTEAEVTVYIEITLLISIDAYSEQRNNLDTAVLEVLQAFSPAEFTNTERATSKTYEIKLSVDVEKSSADISVLKVYIVNSETGEQDPHVTEQFYNNIASEYAEFLNQLKKATSIQVVDVKFVQGPSTEDTTPFLNWWHFLLIALGCVAIALCPVFVACCFRWFSRRREDEEKEGLLMRDSLLETRETEPAGASNGHTVREPRDQEHERRDHVRRVARVGFQSRVQVQSHPLTPVEMENLLQNPATLRSEYKSIPSNLVSISDIPPGAENKNRYRDILPNPQTRVSLFLKFAVSNSDYINANYIRGFRDAGRAYIASQGPLPWTVDDFWRMIWEQKTSVIVMVTGLEEKRRVKCSQYWPDSQVALTASYGDLDVTLKKRTTSNPHYTVSNFHVRHREKLVSRDITHFWFTAWPDHGVPTSTQPALDFLTHIRQYTQEIPAPIAVHCSAGIGRTGVFIGADIGMTQLEREGEVDVMKIVSTMRQDRGGMVQTEQQYIFLHQLLLSYAHQLKDQATTPANGSHKTASDSANATTPDLTLQNNFTKVI